MWNLDLKENNNNKTIKTIKGECLLGGGSNRRVQQGKKLI
jgi:hypothetical protein